ncbi:MAG: hypothetical protein HFJ58_01595 [Clostridia bacterium]|nr:hypothetical protein [Clostridia bacterium]
MDDRNTQKILTAIEQINKNLELTRQEMNSRFETVDSRFDAMHNEMDSRFNTMHNEMNSKFDASNKQSQEILDRLTSLENTVTIIEAEHGKKIDIALEYISGAIQQHDEIMETLNKINSKLDGHDVHIEVLEEKVL